MVILDTNIIIDHLRQKEVGDTLLMKLVSSIPLSELSVSVITIQELYEGKSSVDEKAESYLLATINPLRILPYDYEIAKIAGEIARDLDRPIELADATIAATAILQKARLITRNRKDFKGIPELLFYA